MEQNNKQSNMFKCRLPVLVRAGSQAAAASWGVAVPAVLWGAAGGRGGA
jgi:hypothetical protein